MVHESRIVLAQLLNLLLRHALELVGILAFALALVLVAEVDPEEQVDDRRHGNEGHGDGVSAHEAGALVCLVELAGGSVHGHVLQEVEIKKKKKDDLRREPECRPSYQW